jgi:hypothetical protein
MADLASTDVAVIVYSGHRDIAGGGAFKNITLASITFGNGSKTYPANGIPLPAIGAFGFRKEINFVIVAQPPGDGFIYKYDPVNYSIRVYTQGAKTGATVAADSASGALAENSAGAEGAARVMGSAVNSTYDLGPMIELPAAITLASKTLQLLMIGV